MTLAVLSGGGLFLHQFLERCEVFLVVNHLALSGVSVVDTSLEVCLDLVADNLHRTINQSVLLGEVLVNDSQCCREPAVWELVCVDATDAARNLIGNGKMTGTIKQDALGMARVLALLADNALAGKALLTGTEDYPVDDGVAKIRIPYEKYLG